VTRGEVYFIRFDALDSKSSSLHGECGFESHPRHSILYLTPLIWVNYRNQTKLNANKRNQTVLVCFGMFWSPFGHWLIHGLRLKNWRF